MYFSTLQSQLARRLVASAAAQIELEKESINVSPLRGLVSDLNGSVPPELQCFFNFGVFRCDPFVSNRIGETHFNMSKLRNLAISKALAANVEWLSFCDADTVVVKQPELSPSKPYCVPDVYWQRTPGESISDSLSIIEDEGPACFSRGNSWFIVHRAIFQHVDFNERLYGYGYEDIDFDNRLRSIGVNLEHVNGLIIHRFHEHSERNIVEDVFARNRAITLANAIAFGLNNQLDWRNTEVLTLDANTTLRTCVYYEQINLLVDPNEPRFCHPEIRQQYWRLVWNEDTPETYTKDNEVLRRVLQH